MPTSTRSAGKGRGKGGAPAAFYDSPIPISAKTTAIMIGATFAAAVAVVVATQHAMQHARFVSVFTSVVWVFVSVARAENGSEDEGDMGLRS